MKARTAFYLLLLTAGALFIHGYHPFAEDAAFYIPPIKRLLNPALYPYGAEFFLSHAGLTFFPNLIAVSVQVIRLPLDVLLLAGHLATVYLFLLGCWKVSCLCFEDPAARWCAVSLEAALLTMPVTGTALFLMDQYLNPRSISTFAVMFAVAFALERRYVWAIASLLAVGLVHPLMPVYGIFFVLLIAWNQTRAAKAEAVAALLALGISFGAPTAAYHQAALLHWQHYVLRWPWYCWAGIFAPIAIFYCFARIARVRRMAGVELLCRSLMPFVVAALVGALILDIPSRFEALARFQPLRSLHLAYALMVLLAGGLAGQFLLRRSVVRWLLVFVPLCAGMAYIQFQLFPATEHIEWPGVKSRNGWVRAFEWVRQNTPVNAYFALDPLYMQAPGEDEHSFRAIAERSMLADAVKDSGAVTMFPGLAEKWWEQVEAQQGWESFQAADFEKLKARYGVNWVVLPRSRVATLTCPYQDPNSNLAVCQVD